MKKSTNKKDGKFVSKNDNSITDKNIINILSKVDIIRNDLNNVLISREKIIDLSIISIIAQENIVLLGPPGTAKSMLANEICSRIDGANIFQRLLTKFTDETELFVSGQSLSDENVSVGKRKIKITKIQKYTDGMLPDHDIAFLDEIFKGNSAILNALLTLINEKVYFTNDGKKVKSRLLTVFGASNERPDPGAGLEALYDRFLIRYYIDYLKDEDFIKLLKLSNDRNKNNILQISKKELLNLNNYLEKIYIPENIYIFLNRIKQILESHPELNILKPSDRRMKNSLKLLKAHALIYKRNVVNEKDISEIYPYILWDTTPGSSSNLKYQALRELEYILLDITTADMKEFFEYEKIIKKHNIEIEEMKANVRIEMTSGNKKNLDPLIKDIFERLPKVTAEINTYIKKIDNKLSSDLQQSEKTWLITFKNTLTKLIIDYDKTTYDLVNLMKSN